MDNCSQTLISPPASLAAYYILESKLQCSIHVCSFNLGYVFTDDVTGMKGPSSSINSQNGTCHDKKEATGVVPQNSLSQKIQLTENDNIPEEVSLLTMQIKHAH